MSLGLSCSEVHVCQSTVGHGNIFGIIWLQHNVSERNTYYNE